MGNNNKRKTSAMDMTTGSIPLNILKFSIPLMLAQILEVLFNMSDVAVVGKFSSYEALGAVGSTSLLVTLFTGFLIGMGCGVNVPDPDPSQTLLSPEPGNRRLLCTHSEILHQTYHSSSEQYGSVSR